MCPTAGRQWTRVLILTFIIISGMAACAVSKSAPTFASFSEPPSPANYLYIFRKYAEPTAWQPTVHIDGYEIASFPQEGFTFVAVSPTTHRIESTWPMLAGVPNVKFVATTTTARVMNVPETVARDTLSQCCRYIVPKVDKVAEK